MEKSFLKPFVLAPGATGFISIVGPSSCLDVIAFALTLACFPISPTFAYTYASISSTGGSTS